MFEDFTNEYQKPMVETLQELLRIESVKSEPVNGCPFGVGPSQALDYVLNLAKSYGFEIKNVDGYAGHVEYGTGDDYVGVLSHLDVVPAGSGWAYPPFGAEIHNGNIYARGAIDDKGPAMSSLWALIALKKAGIVPKRKIRLIFGLDEESDWDCVNHYFSKEPKPLGGFTPDSDFPLIYAEKGLATLRISVRAESDIMGPRVVQFVGGSRVNMVPDHAYADVECYSETAANEWKEYLLKTARQKQIEADISVSGSQIQIVVHGVSAHASIPDTGRNAIVHLAVLLGSRTISNGTMWRAIGNQSTSGCELGINCTDEVTGALTSNLGVAELTNGTFSFYFNVRYPVHANIDEISARCTEYLPDKWKVEVVESLLPIYMSLDSPVVETLLKVYREATGDLTEPMTIGGATYARAIPNAVAFGALYPGQAELAHQKDECWSVEDYYRTVQIYAQAMMELANTL
jgi:succinyl-diaminopimelate desuccinylase